MTIRQLLISAGAMKAGTSWLFKQMERHDQIETVPIKEIHYFAHVHSPLAFLSEGGRMHNFKTYVKTCNEGRSFLFTEGRNVYKADFSNMACILDEQALKHIRNMSPRIKVIYTLRDPLARLWSHIKFHAKVINESEDISQFTRKRFYHYIIDCGAHLQSDYAANIKRMRESFEEKELMVCYAENYTRSPQHALNEIYDFLEISPRRYDDAALRERHNEGPAGNCPIPFLEAAADFLLPQKEALKSIGVDPHPNWDYEQRLTNIPIEPTNVEPAKLYRLLNWRKSA